MFGPKFDDFSNPQEKKEPDYMNLKLTKEEIEALAEKEHKIAREGTSRTGEEVYAPAFEPGKELTPDEMREVSKKEKEAIRNTAEAMKEEYKNKEGHSFVDQYPAPEELTSKQMSEIAEKERKMIKNEVKNLEDKE